MGLPYGLYWGFSIVGWLRAVNSRASRTLGAVGARGVVHRPQFNGKQEGAVVMHGAPGLRCPRNGQRTNHPIPSPLHTPLCALANQAHGKAWGGVPPALVAANMVSARAPLDWCAGYAESRITQMLAGKPARVVCCL